MPLKLLATLNRRTAPWIVAVAAGVAAFSAARSFLADQVESTQSRFADQFEMARIVVASRDIGSGEVLTTENLAIRAVPVRYAPSDVVLEGDALRLEGRVLINAVKAGDPLRDSGTTGAAGQQLSSVIGGGRRALTIEVSDVDTFAGLLRVGDRVDLLFQSTSAASMLLPNRTADPTITPLLQSIRVLATGSSMAANYALIPPEGVSEQMRHFDTITLEVSQEEALRIVLAQANGELRVILRGTTDTAVVAPTRLTLSQVLGIISERSSKRGSTRNVEYIIGGRAVKSSARGSK